MALAAVRTTNYTLGARVRRQVSKLPQPIILVQRVVTVWTKKSRGAPGSIHRKAVPDAMSLPLNRFAKTRFALLEHNVTFYEKSEFEDPQEKSSTFESLGQQGCKRFGCVEVHRTEEVCRSPGGMTRDAGLPDRAMTQWICSLGVNSWARAVFNGRYSLDCEGGWWYEKKVVNVGLFNMPSEMVFKDGAPGVILDRMAMLY